jgi:hypothetical protein
MNHSFLITNQQQIDTNRYLIPNRLKIKAIKVRTALINFTEKNVVEHEARLGVSAVGIHTSPPTFETFHIPDGAYTPQQYADKLKDVLNKVQQTESDPSFSPETMWEGPVVWDVKYNEASQKFEFWGQQRHNYDYNLYLHFNEAASDYVGLPYGSWMEFERFGGGSNFATPPNKALTLPKFYRICSNNLSQFGFSYDSSLGSNIIAVVPIDYSKKWTVYENQDNFFHFRVLNQCELQTMINLEIFLDESIIPITNPEFAITFHIQS